MSLPPNRPLRAARRSLLALALLVPLLSAQDGVGAQDGPVDGSSLVSARLLALDARVPAGGSTWVGLQLTIEPGWHVYYRGTNDSGLPLKVSWHLPPGLSMGELHWPLPERHVVAGFLLDHVYHDQVVLLAPLSVAEDVTRERLTVGARVEFLVCEERCLEGAASPVLSLELGEADGAGRGTETVAAARKALPTPAPPELRVSFEDDSVVIRLPGARGLAFLPRDDCLGLTGLVEDGAAEGDRLVLRRDPRLRPESPLTGILRVGPPDGVAAASHFLNIPSPR